VEACDAREGPRRVTRLLLDFVIVSFVARVGSRRGGRDVVASRTVCVLGGRARGRVRRRSWVDGAVRGDGGVLRHEVRAVDVAGVLSRTSSLFAVVSAID